MPEQSQQLRGVFERVNYVKKDGQWTPVASGVWYVRWADRDGRVRKEKGGTRAAAKKLYSVRRGEALKGVPHKFKAKRVTFKDLAVAALEHSKIHKKSYADDVERMAVLVEWFGNKTADSIKPQDIERKLSEAVARTTRKANPKKAQKTYKAATPLAAATQNRYKALMSLAYRLAVKNGKVAINPVHQVEHRKEDNGVIRYLTPTEEAKLKAVIEPKHPERWALIQLALHSGCRAGELWSLQHTQVDRTRALMVLLDTKNGENRTVPLNDAALAALDVLKTVDEGKGYVLPRQAYGGWFRIALKKASIENFTFHCLRHSFGSRLCNAGVDITTVAKLMGHKNVQLTMRYSHPAPEHLMEAVQKITVPKTVPSLIPPPMVTSIMTASISA